MDAIKTRLSSLLTYSKANPIIIVGTLGLVLAATAKVAEVAKATRA